MFCSRTVGRQSYSSAGPTSRKARIAPTLAQLPRRALLGAVCAVPAVAVIPAEAGIPGGRARSGSPRGPGLRRDDGSWERAAAGLAAAEAAPRSVPLNRPHRRLVPEKLPGPLVRRELELPGQCRSVRRGRPKQPLQRHLVPDPDRIADLVRRPPPPPPAGRRRGLTPGVCHSGRKIEYPSPPRGEGRVRGSASEGSFGLRAPHPDPLPAGERGPRGGWNNDCRK
jgi:hypothetical protein